SAGVGSDNSGLVVLPALPYNTSPLWVPTSKRQISEAKERPASRTKLFSHEPWHHRSFPHVFGNSRATVASSECSSRRESRSRAGDYCCAFLAGPGEHQECPECVSVALHVQ